MQPVVNVLKSLLYFPIWWYGKGLVRIAQSIVVQAHELVHTLNLGVLARFLFTPMYGLTDFWSRAISFPVRVVHFLLLSTFALIYIMWLIVLLLGWILLPVFIIYNIGYQLHFYSLWQQ